MRRIKAEILDQSLALVPQTVPRTVRQIKREEVPVSSALAIRSLDTSLVRSSGKKGKDNQGKIKDAISGSMAYVQQRFMFNIEQIEKRYSEQSSGLVFNLKNDKVEFDAEECTARNEKDLLNNVKKELSKHTLGDYGGSALLSTPAEDPDEKDKAKLGRWTKLNKLYDTFLKNSQKQKKNNQQLQVRKTPQLQRIAKFEPLQDITNVTPRQFIHYPSNLFSQVIRQSDQVSIAESRNIDEPVVMPLLTQPFRTPRVKNAILMSEQRVTRAQKRLLEIEENYDRNENAIYVDGSDWVDRWVQQSVLPQTPLFQTPIAPVAKISELGRKNGRKDSAKRSNSSEIQENESTLRIKRPKFERC